MRSAITAHDEMTSRSGVYARTERRGLNELQALNARYAEHDRLEAERPREVSMRAADRQPFPELLSGRNPLRVMKLARHALNEKDAYGWWK